MFLSSRQSLYWTPISKEKKNPFLHLMAVTKLILYI